MTTFESLLKLTRLAAFHWSTSTPPTVVRSRGEAVRTIARYRLERRYLAREFRRATGESLSAVKRRKRRAAMHG